PSFVRHLWSIAVEVQFYVLCPFLVGWLARRRPKVAVTALVAGIAGSATLMVVLYRSPDPSRAYFGTDTRIHALLVGCLLALLLGLRERRLLGKRPHLPYLLHWPLVILVIPGTRAEWPAMPAGVVIVGGGLLLGAISYRYVERPFLRAAAPPVARARRGRAV